jgi:hypothetical protein
MDGAGFDTLAKTVGRPSTRRGRLRLLAGGVLGGARGRRGRAAAAQDVVAGRIGCRGRGAQG